MSQNNPKNPNPRFPTSTKNPCNEFLVQHLLKLRQRQGNFKPMRGKSKFTDHQYHLYTRAVDSIRKYPLPIVCGEQLGMLAGIGNGLVGKLVGVLRGHYRRFLRGVEEKEERDEKPGEKMVKKVKSQQQLSWIPSNSSARSEGQISQQQDLESSSQNRDKMPLPNLHSHPQSQSQPDPQAKSTKSDNLSKRQTYKPRQGTLASNILKVMKLKNAADNSMTKKDIDKALLENGLERAKQWKGARENLVNGGFIQVDPSVDYQAFFITGKGLEFVSENQEQVNSNLTKRKMQSQISLFKEKFLQKQRQQEQASISNAISLHSFHSLQNSQSTHTNSHSHSHSHSLPNSLPLPKKLLHPSPNQSLIILIDTRQMKDQDEKSFFQQTFVEKYKIDVMTQVLTIGDFAFAYNGEVLDYVFERKKADDLSASIIDGRYKEQKMRLKNCGAANVVYLYEGHPSESSVLKQKELMNALQKTRAADGFKVYKTARTTETVKLIASFHSELQKRINNGEQLRTIGTIEQFNRRNAKNRYLTVQTVFGLGLKSFPNVGKQTVSNILRYFKSYYLLYQELKKYENNEERVQFLNGLLKGGRTQAGVTNLIVECLFGSYGGKGEKGEKSGQGMSQSGEGE